MELREFIRQSLIDVMYGISDAQQELCRSDYQSGVIAPSDPDGLTRAETVRQLQFDVAITASECRGQSGEGGIKVAGVGATGQLSKEDANSVTSRILFSVPFVPTLTPISFVRSEGPRHPIEED